jgi:hypothetical protein
MDKTNIHEMLSQQKKATQLNIKDGSPNGMMSQENLIYN